MRNTAGYKIVILSSLLCVTCSAFSWNHGISIGYGGGSDINHHTDTNSGEFLNAEILSLKQKNWYNLTLSGDLGNWESSFSQNKHLFTTAVALSFRPYIFNTATVHPFGLISAGPAYLSERHFGRNSQGANFAFQSIVGAGVELGREKRVDLTLRLIHYSNAYLFNPNQGFNIFYIGSIGYLF